MMDIGWAFSCSSNLFSHLFCASFSSELQPGLPEHFGYFEQLSHNPLTPRRRFSDAPHFGHGISVSNGGGFGGMRRPFLSSFTLPSQSGYLEQLRKGPNRPLRNNIGAPHFGHATSVCSGERGFPLRSMGAENLHLGYCEQLRNRPLLPKR